MTVANNLRQVEPKSVKAGKTDKGTERNLNAQTRLKNAWAVAKAQGLKMLTKACFGVQTPKNDMGNNEVNPFDVISDICLWEKEGSRRLYITTKEGKKYVHYLSKSQKDLRYNNESDCPTEVFDLAKKLLKTVGKTHICSFRSYEIENYLNPQPKKTTSNSSKYSQEERWEMDADLGYFG